MSTAQMEARKVGLAAKQEMVEKAYDLALEKLCSMPDEQYVKTVADLLVQAAPNGRGAVIFAPAERERIGEAAVRAANEKLHGGKLTSFSFRNKANGWEGYHIRAEFDNDKEFQQPAAENPYQRGFIKGLYSRSSCFVCKFKGIERCSDITLADYWGVKGIQPEAYNPQGTSLILLHSEKGRSLLDGCKDQLQLQPAAKDAFYFNSAVLTPIKKPARYDEFWEGYGQTAFADLVSACCEPTKDELAQERRSKSLLARVMRRLKR